jgi:hypothetical protein
MSLLPPAFHIAMRHAVSVLLEYIEMQCLLDILCRVQAQSCSWEAVPFHNIQFSYNSQLPGVSLAGIRFSA